MARLKFARRQPCVFVVGVIQSVCLRRSLSVSVCLRGSSVLSRCRGLTVVVELRSFLYVFCARVWHPLATRHFGSQVLALFVRFPLVCTILHDLRDPSDIDSGNFELELQFSALHVMALEQKRQRTASAGAATSNAGALPKTPMGVPQPPPAVTPDKSKGGMERSSSMEALLAGFREMPALFAQQMKEVPNPTLTELSQSNTELAEKADVLGKQQEVINFAQQENKDKVISAVNDVHAHVSQVKGNLKSVKAEMMEKIAEQDNKLQELQGAMDVDASSADSMRTSSTRRGTYKARENNHGPMNSTAQDKPIRVLIGGFVKPEHKDMYAPSSDIKAEIQAVIRKLPQKFQDEVDAVYCYTKEAKTGRVQLKPRERKAMCGNGYLQGAQP